MNPLGKTHRKLMRGKHRERLVFRAKEGRDERSGGLHDPETSRHRGLYESTNSAWQNLTQGVLELPKGSNPRGWGGRSGF